VAALASELLRLSDSVKVDPIVAAPVLAEANELLAISISSINTAKRNAGLVE